MWGAEQYYNFHLYVRAVENRFYHPFIKIKHFMGNGIF